MINNVNNIRVINAVTVDAPKKEKTPVNFINETNAGQKPKRKRKKSKK